MADLIQFGSKETELWQQIKKKRTIIAGLIDPEDFTPKEAGQIAASVEGTGGSLILIGGSTVANQKQLDEIVISVKKKITLPVILFPNNITGVSQYADAILFTSLLNSSNPYFIVGAQALGAIQIRKYGLEAIPVAYLVVGQGSTTSFIADVREIPADKPSLAVMYSLAAQYMGMRAVYLEAGSGSKSSIHPEMIQAVRSHFSGLLIVGGGITQPGIASDMSRAGADILVIGNLLRSKTFVDDFRNIVKAVNQST